MWHQLAQALMEKAGVDAEVLTHQRLSDNANHHCYRLQTKNQRFFAKVLPRHQLECLESEWQSLECLRQHSPLHVPRPILIDSSKAHAVLVMEWLALQPGSEEQWFMLGQKLRQQHQHSNQAMFGFDDDTYLAGQPQPNKWHKKWAVFFAEQRIGWQLQCLHEKGICFGDPDTLISRVHALLCQHHCRPSLLHGDLWRGNVGFCEQGPVIYDPACYYGDADAELAMTELFGRFPEAFYQGYGLLPHDEKRLARKQIYQLYHLLNHAWNFGEPYISQCRQIIDNWLRA